MREAARIQGLPNPRDAAVHHVARRHEVHAGARLHDGNLAEQVDGRVVVDVAVSNHAAVAMIGVFAQAYVAHHEQLRYGTFDGANCLLHDALIVVRFRPGRILGRRNAEQDDAAQPQ